MAFALAAKPPAALRCPACSKIFADPLISINCGHTFCSGCVTGTCPADGRPLALDKVGNPLVLEQSCGRCLVCMSSYGRQFQI
jgi:hypothetical protein